VAGADRPSAIPERSSLALSPVVLRNRACSRRPSCSPASGSRGGWGGRAGAGPRCLDRVVAGAAVVRRVAAGAGGWRLAEAGGADGHAGDGPATVAPVVTVQAALSTAGAGPTPLYGDLDIPRRIAQVELSLNVLTEMGGELQAAARGYARLVGDERLSGRDRARAQLWIGTGLSKDGERDDHLGLPPDALRSAPVLSRHRPGQP
jgi:hypothetical protein